MARCIKIGLVMLSPRKLKMYKKLSSFYSIVLMSSTCPLSNILFLLLNIPGRQWLNESIAQMLFVLVQLLCISSAGGWKSTP